MHLRRRANVPQQRHGARLTQQIQEFARAAASYEGISPNDIAIAPESPRLKLSCKPRTLHFPI